MNSVSSVDWPLLLDTRKSVTNVIKSWATGQTSTREVTDSLAFSEFSGEFRNLVRERGTTEARRLARKALRYRDLV